MLRCAPRSANRCRAGQLPEPLCLVAAEVQHPSPSTLRCTFKREGNRLAPEEMAGLGDEFWL
jgi:hypothetical protein